MKIPIGKAENATVKLTAPNSNSLEVGSSIEDNILFIQFTT